MTGQDNGTLVHPAGPVMYYTRADGKDLVRQRCMWCGTVLIDADLSRIAAQLNPDGSAPPFATWEAGGMVGVNGGMQWLVWTAEQTQSRHISEMTETCCMTLDPAVTA